MSEQLNTTEDSVSSISKSPTINLNDEADAFLKFVDEVGMILFLSTRGISMHRAVPGAVKALANVKALEVVPEEVQARIEHAEEMAKCAEEEVKNGFPLLYAHSVVAIWSALEATIPRMAVAWLVERPIALQREAFQKIKLPLASYDTIKGEALMEYAIEELFKSQQNSDYGIGRFEAVLNEIGLGGGLDPKKRRDIFELLQVRNLVVHRYGRVDKRFMAICPWITTTLGERVKITHQDYVRYRDACVEYITEVIWRAVHVKGGKRPDVGRYCEWTDTGRPSAGV